MERSEKALQINVQGNTVTVANSEGTVAALDARTGADIWRSSVGAGLAAGVGSDGRFAAVVTQGNELVVLDAGRVVEQGPTERVMDAPEAEYTRDLLSAIPHPPV